MAGVRAMGVLMQLPNTAVLWRAAWPVALFVFHYLVGTPEGVERFTERHELGLFTVEEYLAAFRACGLEVEYDPLWLNGRGLYMALKPGEI